MYSINPKQIKNKMIRYMDPQWIALIIGITSLTGVVVKFVHSMRNDIKECFCLKFRTPEHSQHDNVPDMQREMTVDVVDNLPTTRTLQLQQSFNIQPQPRTMEC